MEKYITAYQTAGLNVTPLRSKRPILMDWVNKSATLSDFDKADGVGLICGNGLEAVDVDCKYDLSGDLWERLSALIPAETLAKTVIQKTPSGGYHIVYYCEEIEGNQKLAQRPATAQELAQAPNTKRYVLVETRGEGGQIAIYPSPGYKFIQGTPLSLQAITVDERAAIMAAARSFDQMPAKAPVAAPMPARPQSQTSTEAAPWERYSQETSGLDILQAHGWRVLKQGRDGKGRDLYEVARPGSDRKSASYYPGENLVFSHTTSSDLPSEQPLKPSALLAYLEYGGDFKRMGAALAERYAPTTPLMLVFGEEAAQAASAVSKWETADVNGQWRYKGRDVIVWPSHDLRQYDRARKLMDKISQGAKSVRFVSNPQDAPKGWHVGQSGWSAAEIEAYVRANLVKPAEADPPTPEPEPQPENKHEAWEGCVDFRPLGYGRTDNGPVFYFYSIRAGLIVPLSPSSLSKSNLLGLAELNYWERAFPSNSKRANIDWDAAQDFLISACMDKGFFDPFSIRGRGAWLDDGRIVVHSGDKLIVDGVPMPIHKLKSKFVYEAALPLDIATANPLTRIESAALLDALKFCNWSRNANGVLLAGWCVIAPVCGALKWRPHIWLTGAADSGKTWIYREIVAPILGAPALRVQSATTAAGLRALLNTDGRPVVFEEAEQTSQTSAARIAEVMELIRASSADDSGAIAKGSVTGAPRQYVMRACFAMASINVPITEPSDARRFTILSAASVRNQERRSAHFKELQAKVLKVTTKEFRERLQARTLAMLPTILANLETFKAVTSAVLGRTAYGDQLAPMLAGAYALEHDGLVTLEAAKAYVEGLDWSEEKALDTTRDEMACLNHLLETMVQVESSMGKLERNIGELLFAARGVVYPVPVSPPDDGVTPYNADARLRRLGIKIEMIDGHPYMVVSNSSKDIKGFFKGKENWSANHGAILKRIEGAKTVGSTTFSPAIKSRAVAIPMDLLEN